MYWRNGKPGISLYTFNGLLKNNERKMQERTDNTKELSKTS